MSQPWQSPHQPNQPFGQPSSPSGPPSNQPYGTPPYGTPTPGSPYGTPPYGTPPDPGHGHPPAGRAPLGQQPLPTDDITRYAPPKQRGPVLAAVAGLVVLVAVVAVGLFLQRPAPVPGPTPTPTASTPDRSNLPGQRFTMPSNADATGRWQVLSQEWTSEGVLVQVRVDCDTETCSYGFTSFPNTGATSVNPVASPRRPELNRGILRAGENATGYVFLPLPRGAATLILTTSAGRQISALPISA